MTSGIPGLTEAPRDTQERILKNALQHFCDYGYSGSSVREITAASEVTKPTLYYYFKNKEELFTKLANTCFDLVLSQVTDVPKKQRGYEPRVKALFQCIDAVARHNPTALRFVHGLMVSPQRGAPEVGAKNFLKEIEDALKLILDEAVNEGQCMADKRHNMQLVFLALLLYYTSIVMQSEKISPAQQELIDTLIKNLVFCSNNGSCSSG
jgi:AcrR family transcriptional regulator